MANREIENEPESVNQKKGMQIPVFSKPRLRNPSLRQTLPQQPGASQPQQQRRDISTLSRQLKDLSLNDKPNKNAKGGQVVSNQSQQPPSLPSQSEAETEIITPTLQQDEAARGNPLGPADSQSAPAPVPATPPESRKFNEAMDTVRKGLQSPCKAPLSPFKSSCSPTKPSFLSKESSVTSFTGWDVDGRLNEFESQFKVMKETFEGTMTDRKVLEEAIDMAKNRGIYHQAAGTLVKC
jgi:kinesin family protein C1